MGIVFSTDRGIGQGWPSHQPPVPENKYLACSLSEARHHACTFEWQILIFANDLYHYMHVTVYIFNESSGNGADYI